MKYKIKITGGFANFPQEFEGTLPLSDEEAQEVKEAATSLSQEHNPDIRDGLQYDAVFDFGDERIAASFADDNLPRALSDVIDRIKS